MSFQLGYLIGIPSEPERGAARLPSATGPGRGGCRCNRYYGRCKGETRDGGVGKAGEPAKWEPEFSLRRAGAAPFRVRTTSDRVPVARSEGRRSRPERCG